MSVLIDSVGGNCPIDISIKQDGSLMWCGDVYVDVNGANGPNRFGRDLFAFYITKTGIYPYGLHEGRPFTGFGYWNDPTWGGCNPGSHKGTEGYQCAGRIIDQGWMMGY